MKSYEHQYMKILADLVVKLDNLGSTPDRTGTGTARIFAPQLTADLRHGLPMLTTKKLHLHSIIVELLWFLRGDTNVQFLQENKCKIWDEWADSEGNLGPLYGQQWRSWGSMAGGTDQILEILRGLEERPFSRRHIVSAWNVTDLPDESMSPQENVANGKMALAPCHCLFQFFVEEIPFNQRHALALKTLEGKVLNRFLSLKDPKAAEKYMTKHKVPAYYLDLQLYQRSADWFLGVPFNAVSYSLLQMLIAHKTYMVARTFVHTFGDAHLYSNHRSAALEQLNRDQRPMPFIHFTHDRGTELHKLEPEHFILDGYKPHPAIKAPVSV